MQPRRAAASGKLRDKRVSQFMLQNVRQFRRHGIEATNGDAQLAIVDRSAPAGGMSDVEKCLFGVEGHKNTVAWRVAEIANQVVIIGLEERQDLIAKCIRCLLALLVEYAM